MKSRNTVRPRYKKIILDVTQIDQLGSYLGIATLNIADHAKKDCEEFFAEIRKQLDKQKLKHKKVL